MAIYMQYNGDAVKGDVTSEGYKNWMDVSSLQFGVGRGISSQAGSMSNRESTMPSVSEVVITKSMDASSALLLKESFAGSEGVTVVLAMVRTGKDMPEEVGRIVLENVLVSSYSMSSGGDRPQESVSLNFSKVEFDLKGADVANKNGPNIKVGYDLAAGKSL